MPGSDEKRISCKRCQTRKIKCSRTSPCRKCSTAGVRCEYREYDSKRAPITREYVTSLESRVASLETYLLKLTSPESAIVTRFASADKLLIGDAELESEMDLNEQEHNTSGWRHDKDWSFVYHGPSSMYSTRIMCSNDAPSISTRTETNVPRCPIIMECIDHFFRWHHSSFPVVDQVELLKDLSQVNTDCPISLVYSICALGALMSAKSKIREKANTYRDMAKAAVDSETFRPSLAMLQACMLLALFEAGQGNTSNAWMYSGIALRMKDELGPKSNLLDNFKGNKSGTLSGIDDTWARMHMNCYKSDKMFGLFLGRPATVEKTTHLKNQVESSPLETSIASKHTELCQVIHDCVGFLSDEKPVSQNTGLARLNTRLCGWYDLLPGKLRWNKWASSTDHLDVGIAALHMLYHTAKLSLNRRFVSHSSLDPLILPLESTNICLVSVETVVSILQRYKAQHSLKSSPFIFVHATIIAVDVSLSLRIEDGKNTALTVLDAALVDLSYSWEIARDARIGLQKYKESIKQRVTEEDLSPAFRSEYEGYEFGTPQDTGAFDVGCIGFGGCGF